MGIKHLKRVRSFLSGSSDSYFLRGHLRAKLKIEAKTLDECLDYLVNTEKSVSKKIEGREYYKWKKTANSVGNQ